MSDNVYFLLTEFEVRTVSYGPSFSRLLMAQARSARAINRREKTSTDRENEVSKIFIISLRLIGRTETEIFKVSGPYYKVRPAKLTNHSARTN